MMEVSEGVKENTVTFVQVLTVADVAEAAALAVAELGQNQLGQNGANQVMQIVTMQAPVETAGSMVTVAGEQVVTTATTNSTTTPATLAEPNPSNQITITSIPDGNNDERLCLICGDRANGVHYNVLSCEGCKSFFLRSNRSGATFTCQQGGNCNMDLYTRRHCPACRMKKCLAYGMKVERVWDKDRLKTRKPLIRMKRKRKQPKQPAETQTSSTLPPPSPAVQSSPSPAMQAPSTPSVQATHTQGLTPALAPPGPTAAGASGTTTPSSSRSNSPKQQTEPVSVTATGTPPTATPVAIFKTGDAALSSNPQATLGDGQGGTLPADPSDPSGTSTQTLLTISPAYPQLTAAQEQLMLTLEKGYKASTEVLKHLSKDVPLFRMTHWSKLKSSDNSPSTATESSDDEDDDEDEDRTEPKKPKPYTETVTANTNSEALPSVTAAAAGVLTATPDSDPLATLSAATGQSTDTIYKLTSLATGGQITDPASALNVLVSSEQGMRVIQTIGTMVQGQDLNALISLATLVGQIIGTGGGTLNDTIAETILGSIMGSIRNNAPEASGAIGFPGQAVQNTSLAASSSTSSGDQSGNKDSQSSQDDLAAFAQLASSGLAEALAMLAAMASSSQNKETIVEMVKRAAVSLLKGKGAQHMSMALPPATASSSNLYMPTDVGEEEVKMSPFLQSLQKVTSFLTSGKMSAETKSKTRAKRTVNKEMLHIAMDMFAVLVKQTIHFAKSIPGFTNLSCDDQAVLIKSSIVDALLLRCADSYALDKDCLVNDTNGDKFDVHMMYQLGFSTLPEVVFEFMRDTKACGLTTAEYALFTAAALLSPDRSDLKDRGTVEEMQLEMILTLQSATKVFHPDRPFLFTKLITKLTTLRDMSILHLSEIMAVKVQEQDLSPLIVELFGLDS